MTPQQLAPRAAGLSTDDGSAAEMYLARVLTLIHRILPRLDESGRSAEVQDSFRKAASFLDQARQAYEQEAGVRPRAAVALSVGRGPQTTVDSEIVAIIAAAVAAVLDRPYRLVSVQLVSAPVPHLNVWALEGRTQIFQSHKVR
jgi:hypothetical protein